MLLYKTLWGAVGADAPHSTLEAAIPVIASQGWDGVSFALIALQFEPGIGDLDGLGELCDSHDLGLSVMVHTFGDSVSDHLAHLESQLETAASVEPHHVICHGGVDAWSLEQASEFYEAATSMERRAGVPVAHETHRSRLLHSPWQTTAILEMFPDLNIALDLSHWVVMAERLLEDQTAAIEHAAERSIHVDARIGHEQGPQVPDPRDQAWAIQTAAFEGWWDLAIGPETVVVPEYGPPPYLPTTPHSNQPVADLWDISDWAGKRLRRRYRQ